MIIKKFLILQEAVLLPLYKGIADTPEDLAEEKPRGGFAIVSTKFGLNATAGQEIVDATTSFMKGVSGFWTTLIGWSLVGALVAAVTVGVAAPAIAATIGGMMGLHGAAAFSAGMALLGGGAVAAGGAGMAGGFCVLVGGGALLAASTSAGVCALAKSPVEFVSLSAAKLFGFAAYLRRQEGPVARESYLEAVTDFLNMKHEAERSLLCNDAEAEPLRKLVKTLHFTLERLAALE